MDNNTKDIEEICRLIKSFPDFKITEKDKRTILNTLLEKFGYDIIKDEKNAEKI